MTSNISGVLKGLKAQVKQEVNKLSTPRPQQPAGQQRPPQAYAQQQVPQQYGSPGVVSGSQPSQGQYASVMYQQHLQQPQPVQQPQFAPSQVQSPFNHGQYYVVPTSQPQSQIQTQQSQQYQPHPQIQQCVTSPQPQVTTPFQPQYQTQVPQQISPMQNQQYAPPINQSPQIQGQFQPFYPQTIAQPTQQVHQQHAPGPVARYSPANSNFQDEARRQSQVVVQPQQGFHSPGYTPPTCQNTATTSPGHTPTEYQSQVPIQSSVSSPAQTSLHSSSPVQVQQAPTHTGYHQSGPTTSPPPAHLIQEPPPQQYINQAKFQSHQYVTSSPTQSLKGSQVQPHSESPHLPTLTQSQKHPQQPSSSPPVGQPYQLPQATSSPSPVHQNTTQIQPQHQQYAYTTPPSQTPILSQSQPHQHIPAQVQQSQPVSTTPGSPLHRNSIPSPSQSPAAGQSQQYVSQSPNQQQNQTVTTSQSQSQFQSQIHNSVRRKPHPVQPIPSPELQISNSNSPQAMATIPDQQAPVPPEARQTSPLSDPSAYQFLTQTQPVELEDHSDLLYKPAVLPQHESSPSTQQARLVIDPPLIESDVKALETVAPKPIHPPPQYEQSPPQQSLPPTEPLYGSTQVSHPTVEDQVASPIYAEILPQTQAQESIIQSPGEPIANEPLQTIPVTQVTIRSEPRSEATIQQPVHFVLQGEFQNEKLPVVDTEDTSIYTRPQYQAYSPVPGSQSQVAGPEAHSANLTADANGRQQYQPYSPDHKNKEHDGYFPPIISDSQGRSDISSSQYQPYQVASHILQGSPKESVSFPAPEESAAPQQMQSSALPMVEHQSEISATTLFNGIRQPRPPSQPCPEHLRNQTPPPESYFQQLRLQSEVPVQKQASKSPAIQHLACSQGRKFALTKYNKFYVPKHSIVPRTDPGVQELKWALCEYCFVLHISQNTNFSLNFEPFISPDLPKTGCDEYPIPTSRAHCQFGYFPMLRYTFYRECLPQSSLQPLLVLIQQFNALPPCPANEVMAGGEYYTSPAIPNSAFCAQCFDAHLKPSSFGANFTMRLNSPGQYWRCHNGQDPGFTSRLLANHLNNPAPDFDEFSRELSERLELPYCVAGNKPILAGPDGKVHAYRIEGLNGIVCPECFYDRVKFTPLEQVFIPREFDSTASDITCDLVSGISRFLFMVALEAKDVNLWHSGMLTFNRIPRCEGIKGVEEETVQAQSTENGADATWYALSEFPTIEACPCCFHSVITPLGGAHLFTPITRQLHAGVIRTCNFSVGNGGITSSNPDDFTYTLYFRGFILRHLLEVGWESKQQDYGPFISISKQLSECAPPCGSNVRGYKRPNGRRWYGRVAKNADENDCTIVMCQECYEVCVKDTNLESTLGTDLTDAVYAGDTYNEKEGFCGPFSKRSKAVLKEAAGKNDWTIFARHWNMRQRVRDSALPLIKALQAEFSMQNMKKMSAMSSAMMVQGGASISEAAGTDGMNHGNSVVGYGFDSAAGVDAAMYKRNADNTQWGDASHIAKIRMLETQWKEVE